MKTDLDKLIRTWESMVASGKLSKNMSAIVIMTIAELKVLKRIKDKHI